MAFNFWNYPPPTLLRKLKFDLRFQKHLVVLCKICWTKFGKIYTKLYPVLGDSVVNSLNFNMYAYNLIFMLLIGYYNEWAYLRIVLKMHKNVRKNLKSYLKHRNISSFFNFSPHLDKFKIWFKILKTIGDSPQKLLNQIQINWHQIVSCTWGQHSW